MGTNCSKVPWPFTNTLASGRKEGVEQGTGLFGEDARCDFHLMIQFGAGQQLEAGAIGAALWIVGSVDHARNAGLNDRASTHGAGLECYVESCLRQAIISELSRSFPEHHDFGVGGRVAISNGAIAAPRENFIPAHQHGTDRDLTGFGACPRFLHRNFHEFLVAHRFPTENITLSARLNGPVISLGSTCAKNP